MFEHSTMTERDRRVTHNFDGPAVESDDGCQWNERIKVAFSHSKDKKRYEAVVSWCKARNEGSYTMEQTAIFSDPAVRFYSQPTARFSDKTFNAFCATARTLCIDMVSNPDDFSTEAELLRKAKGFALVTN